MSGLYLGTARARLGPAAAFIDAERGVAACEENRLTRAVDSGTTSPPELAIAELLRILKRRPDEVTASASVDDNGGVDPHRAHAEYAFQSSGVDEAVVLVCEAHLPRGWSAWRFTRDAAPTPIGEELGDYPIAHAYGQLTERLGMRPMRDEHLVEAMARAGQSEAEVTQRRLGDDLLRLLGELRSLSSASTLCLSGGLFFNTYFTTLAAGSGLFEHTSVPPHPGRNGTAIGAALIIGGRGDVRSAYLGPHYSDSEIKETLENCKLSYDLLPEGRLMDDVLHALSRGRLVGWYHGRLEWGPRALGHRSVLADPFSPHTLENISGFLKRRPAYRAYGVSVPESRLAEFFDGGPVRSPFMQYEYRPRDPEKFRTMLPPGAETIRVHTVDAGEPRFLRLLELWGEKCGAPILVNTSFNGFHEPLVCSPRDAVRVFYGTGLDVLALEDFYLRK